MMHEVAFAKGGSLRLYPSMQASTNAAMLEKLSKRFLVGSGRNSGRIRNLSTSSHLCHYATR